MKRKIFTLSLFALLCGTAFVGCQKEGALEGSKYKTIISVRSADAKSHYQSGSVIWDEGDQINVARGNELAEGPFTFISTDENGVSTFGSNEEFTVSEGSYYAIYPAQADLEIDNGVISCVAIPTQQTLTENSFGSGNNTTVGWGTDCDNMMFYNVGGLAKIAMRGTAMVKSVKITLPGGTLSGRGTIDIMDSHTITAWDDNAVDYVVASAPDQSTGISIDGGKIFYIALPPCKLADYTITVTDIDGNEAEFEPEEEATITRSNVTYLGIYGMDETPVPEPKFSVSATKQVLFSPGNLQYQASTDTWRFASPQYSYAGNDNLSATSTYTGWVDLFCWATSGYNNVYPWLTSDINWNSSIENTNYDWGVNNAIGSDPAGTWRTLTKDEWNYLLNSRPNATALRGWATVGGIGGYILLPDNWPSTPLSDAYTVQTWPSMEASGAVFLPAVGYRFSTNITYCTTKGYYWAATTEQTQFGIQPSIFIFSNTSAAMEVGGKTTGCSVRLVKDVTTSK